MKRYKFSSAIVLECRDTIQKLSESIQISLIWVPGHSKIAGNEKADELARLASSTRFTGPEPATAVSFSTLQRIISDWKAQKFKNHWNSLNTARQARNSIKINDRNTKYLLSLSRSNIKRLTSILTGHNTLKKHLHTIGISTDPYCDMCGDIETTEHFLCHCPAYIKSRATHLGSYTINYNSIWSITPADILKFINKSKRI